MFQHRTFSSGILVYIKSSIINKYKYLFELKETITTLFSIKNTGYSQ